MGEGGGGGGGRSEQVAGEESGVGGGMVSVRCAVWGGRVWERRMRKLTSRLRFRVHWRSAGAARRGLRGGGSIGRGWSSGLGARGRGWRDAWGMGDWRDVSGVWLGCGMAVFIGEVCTLCTLPPCFRHFRGLPSGYSHAGGWCVGDKRGWVCDESADGSCVRRGLGRQRRVWLLLLVPCFIGGPLSRSHVF